MQCSKAKNTLYFTLCILAYAMISVALMGIAHGSLSENGYVNDESKREMMQLVGIAIGMFVLGYLQKLSQTQKKNRSAGVQPHTPLQQPSGAGMESSGTLK